MTQPTTIGLFYGSSTCYTEMSAEKIQGYFGDDKVDVYNLANTPVNVISQYRKIIFGIPTWDYGELQEDWEDIWDELDTLEFNSKRVAIYGQGDQVGYPEWFLDAMGYLHNKLLLKGAILLGYWPNEGYSFSASQALTEDCTQFVGLALDDENQFELSKQRITTWCESLKQHFNL